jgi:D-lactate dehydrogenase
LAKLLEEYEYDSIQTCAADGSCALACPLGIDTGKLVKGLRAREHGPSAERLALRLARRWSAVERAARAGLRAGDVVSRALGPAPVRGATRAMRKLVSDELVPEWPANMPPPARSELPRIARAGAAAVYFPACINRIFGPVRSNGDVSPPSLPATLVSVSARAGHPLWIPDDVAGHCCATPWSSKGYARGSAFMANKVVAALWDWTGEGRLPVVVDASSCTFGLIKDVPAHLTEENRARHDQLEVLDSIAWAHDRLLPDLSVERRAGSAAVHPTCAARQLGLTHRLEGLAEALADEVFTPPSATCCGFAGDRGFLHPELPAAAARQEATELAGRRFDAYLCSNRTCEIGLQQATGAAYASFAYPLEELTRDGREPSLA